MNEQPKKKKETTNNKVDYKIPDEKMKEIQELETQLQLLKGERFANDTINQLKTKIKELETAKTNKASKKVINGLKKDFGGIGKRLFDWWTMANIREAEKQKRKKHWMSLLKQ